MNRGVRSSEFGVRSGPVAVLLVFPLFLLWRALFAGEAFFWGTPLLQFVPWQRMAAAMWREGHLPLWNPLVGCGAPLAANYQTAAFYPLNVLYLLAPAEVALSWTTVLHLVLAGWGMYRWGQAMGLDRFPALIGAMALEGSGFLVARATLFPSMVFTFPWLAVWLWRAEVLAQRKRVRDALWLGLALGLGLLAGHAQTAFYGGVLLVAYLLFRTVQEAKNGKQGAGGKTQETGVYASRITFPVLRSWLLILCASAIGLGLASVQLIPTVELMVSSQRSVGVDYDFAMTYSLWPWRLITFAAPGFFGNPGRGDYWGYPNYWEGAGYVGMLPLLLAVDAVLRRKRGGAEATAGYSRFLGIIAGVGLLLALGDNTPVFPFLFSHVPTFDLFQAPARWLTLTTVALAALAALGAQRWPAGHRGQRRGALGVAVGISLLIGGLAAPRLVSGMSETFGPATVRLGVTLAVASALTLLRREALWWRVVAGGFVMLDLLLFGWSLVPTVDRSLYQEVTAAATYLESEPGPPARVYWPADLRQQSSEYDAEYRVRFSYLTFEDFGPQDVNYWWGMREALLPNAGMLDGVGTVNNFDPLLVGHHADVLDAAVKAPSLLRVVGATHVASDRPWSGGEPVGDWMVELGDGGEVRKDVVRLYRLPDALGRAWVVPADRQVTSDAMLAALTDPTFNPAAEVLLEHPTSSIQYPASSTQRPETSIEYQVILQDIPNGVTIRANLDAPGYLVVADTWYPGWQARVDEELSDILRANYAFRAVWLEAGEHTVEMVYRPASVSAGGAVSLITLALLAVGLLLRRRLGART